MRDRTYTTEDEVFNLHQTRGTQSTAYGDEIKENIYSKKMTGKRFEVKK